MAFISFADNELFKMTIPAKIQSYMACGMPILAVASGETKRVIEEAKCGVCCQLGDIAAVKASILKMMQDVNNPICNMAQFASDYFGKYFSKSELLDEIEKYIRS